MSSPLVGTVSSGVVITSFGGSIPEEMLLDLEEAEVVRTLTWAFIASNELGGEDSNPQ